MTGFSSPASPPRLRRSLLSVPAINERALQKAHTLDCDGAIFDLEDSVAPARKAQARDNLQRFFAQTPFEGRETIIRINALDTPEAQDDLETVLSLSPDAVLLPKVMGATDVADLHAWLEAAGAPQALRIWAMVETPRAVLEIGAIAAERRRNAGRLDALVVGLNDLRKETGVLPQPGRAFLTPWLMQVVLAARAYGLEAIDSVFNDFRDEAGFDAECGQGRAMGFDGKMLIHPAQIAAANGYFGPGATEIAEAESIVAAFAAPQAQGLGVIEIGGRMVERLHLEQAERLLHKARQISARKDSP